MPFFTMIAFFGSFSLGGAGATLWAKVRPPLWLFIFIIPTLIGGYLFLVHFLPFYMFLTEVLLVLLAGAGLSGPMYLFLWIGNEKLKAAKESKDPAAQRRVQMMGIPLLLLFLGCGAATMMTIVSRANYASWIEWACDGPILEVTRDKGNHNNLMLVVQDGGGQVRFEPVAGDLWGRAKPRQHLTKKAGSPMALLDGERVRMVPRQMGWMHEPP